MRTVLIPDDVIKGIFISEQKNRFLCEVDIAGISTVCYVPSSCRLSNLLDLKGKEVLLLPITKPNTRTRFALFAVSYKKNYILLNSSLANSLIGQTIHNRRFSMLGRRRIVSGEYRLGSYKCDFFIHDTNTIVEIKSIITTDKLASFPSVFSQRALDQLQSIKCQLMQGKRACYIIVSLNPYVKTIILDKETEFFRLFQECLRLGIILIGVSCKMEDKQLTINKILKVLY